MVPTVQWVLRHLTTDLFECSAIEMHFFKKLTIAIVTAFHFSQDVAWCGLSAFVIEIDDVVYVVHVHNESTHLLRDFGLCIHHVVDNLRHHLTNELHVISHSL